MTSSLRSPDEITWEVHFGTPLPWYLSCFSKAGKYRQLTQGELDEGGVLRCSREKVLDLLQRQIIDFGLFYRNSLDDLYATTQSRGWSLLRKAARDATIGALEIYHRERSEGGLLFRLGVKKPQIPISTDRQAANRILACLHAPYLKGGTNEEELCEKEERVQRELNGLELSLDFQALQRAFTYYTPQGELVLQSTAYKLELDKILSEYERAKDYLSIFSAEEFSELKRKVVPWKVNGADWFKKMLYKARQIHPEKKFLESKEVSLRQTYEKLGWRLPNFGEDNLLPGREMGRYIKWLDGLQKVADAYLYVFGNVVQEELRGKSYLEVARALASACQERVEDPTCQELLSRLTQFIKGGKLVRFEVQK